MAWGEAFNIFERAANGPLNTFHSIFIFHLQREFPCFCCDFLHSVLYKFVSGSNDYARDSCQLSSAKILTIIMRHMQISSTGFLLQSWSLVKVAVVFTARETFINEYPLQLRTVNKSFVHTTFFELLTNSPADS